MLKAIHIGKSHKPTVKPKLAKEYVFANALKEMKIVANLKDKMTENNEYQWVTKNILHTAISCKYEN